jgi:SAM-dependent methyltransferase
VPGVRRVRRAIVEEFKSLLPSSVKTFVKKAIRAGGRWSSGSAYERHARSMGPEESIGDGDFDLIGRIELRLLQKEGLRPSDTVVDFGCGTGRLAVHLVPFLTQGTYFGIDIAPTMLKHARRRVGEASNCRWLLQKGDRIDLPDASADMMCAYSVFTHLELEDCYRYLVEAARVVRPDGVFLFSCLPLSLAVAREIFLRSAHSTMTQRRWQVRNVVTTEESMETVARLAGWKPTRWYRGDQPDVDLPGVEAVQSLGQSACVLRR